MLGITQHSAQQENVTCHQKSHAHEAEGGSEVSWAGSGPITGTSLRLHRLGCHLGMNELLVSVEERCEK